MPKQKRTALQVRLAPELHRKLVAIARKNNRSLNAEIMYRMEKSFHKEELRAVIERTIKSVLQDVVGKIIKDAIPAPTYYLNADKLESTSIIR